MLLHLHHSADFNIDLDILMKTIQRSISSIMNQIIINACAIFDGKFSLYTIKSHLYMLFSGGTDDKLSALEDITSQNFEKYGLNIHVNSIKGAAVVLTKTDDIALTITRFFKTLNFTRASNPSLKISLPIWDSLTKDLIMSVTTPCGKNEKFGILGINLYFSSLVEDITYFNNYPDYFYAFMIDINGMYII